MGGSPKYAVVSLGVPARLDVRWVDQFYQGMIETAKKFGTVIVGGDTVKSPQIIVNISLAGKVFKNQLVTRAGAKVGDQIFVTGPLGNSLKSGWHLKFTPRLKESQYLVKNFHSTAMIDISDGLASDLGHILKESGVGAKIYEFEIPLRRGASLRHALGDGEDFELLFTVSPREAKTLLEQSKAPFKFYQIGEITDRKTVLEFVDKKGNRRPLPVKGYTHF
jgi:thiamine-monophosphate kinase